MNEWLTIICVLTVAIVASAWIVLASIYDVQVARSRHFVQSTISRLSKPAQPQVTVLVYTRDDAATLAACLRSIYQSRYHHYDVVVIDTMSRDGTKRIARSFAAAHPQMPLRLYAKRRYADRGECFRLGYTRSQQGRYVVALDGNSILTPGMIKRSVALLQVRPQISAIHVGTSIPFQRQIITVARYAVGQSLHWVRKARSARGRYQIDSYCGISIWRADIFWRMHMQTTKGWYDAAPQRQSYSSSHAGDFRLRVTWRHSSILLVICMLYYMTIVGIILATSLHTVQILVTTVALQVGWFLMILWSGFLPIKDKLAAIFSLPVLWLVVLVYSFSVVGARVVRIVIMVNRRDHLSAST
ncbi:MAG: glycosyltransferase [Candidatus Saccharimonadales bacterium]